MKKVLLFIALAVVALLLTLVANTKEKSRFDIVIKQGDKLGIPQLLHSGDSAYVAGDRELAMVNYMLVCNKNDDALSDADRRDMVMAHIKVGDIYFDSGNYSSALEFYLKGQGISEKSGEKPLIQVLHKNIGNVYCVFKDYERGILQYREGLLESESDPETAVKLCQNLMGAFVAIHKVEDARYYYDEAKKIPYEYDSVGKFMTGYIYGLLLYEEGKYGEAADRFREMASFAQKHSLDPKYECSAYEELYKTYMKNHDTDSTLYYLNKCNTFAQANGLTHLFTETYRHLANLYEERGDVDRALRLRSKYLEMQDSIFDMREFDVVKNQQFVYEMSKTEREISELHEQERRRVEMIRWQRAVIIIVVVAVIIVVVLLVTVYRKKRNLDSSYRNLYQLNQQLSESHNRAIENQRRLQQALEQKEECSADKDKKPDGVADGKEETKKSGEVQSKRYSSSGLNETLRAELLSRITKVMEEDMAYCNSDFSLDTLSEMVGSNSRYVSQVINEAYGRNFSNYVNEYKVRLACERFLDKENYGSWTIKAVGESVGFRSHTTFVNVFKNTTGITPSIYLKLAREESAGTDL